MVRREHPTIEVVGKVRSSSETSVDYPRGDEPQKSGVELVAWLMDSAFRIPGLNLRFGFDSIVGLVPGLGDLVTSLVSLIILNHASQRGVSRMTLARMSLNIAIDFLIGSIPFVGDVFDVYWKANNRNVELLKRHLATPVNERRRLRWADTLFVLSLSGGLLLLLGLCLLGTITLITWVITALRNM